MSRSLSKIVPDRFAEIAHRYSEVAADFLTQIVRECVAEECAKRVSLRPTHPSQLAVEAEKLSKSRSSKEVLDSVDVAKELIGKAHKPVHINTIFAEIRARGFQIDTEDPKATYGARLRDNAQRFGLIHLKNLGWWQKERPYAPANYVPKPSAKRLSASAGARVPIPARCKRAGIDLDNDVNDL